MSEICPESAFSLPENKAAVTKALAVGACPSPFGSLTRQLIRDLVKQDDQNAALAGTRTEHTI